MKRQTKDETCCTPPPFGGCKVESLVTVDERGRWSSRRIFGTGRGSREATSWR